MGIDPGLQPTRDIRERISREFGNDPRRLVEHYMEYQRQFPDRLRPPTDPDQHREEAAKQADAPDRPPTGH